MARKRSQRVQETEKAEDSDIVSVASDSDSSNNSLIQISKQKTSNRIAELKEELRILNEKSLNSKVVQTTPKKTKKIQNVTIDSKNIYKPVKREGKEPEWFSSDPEQVILIKQLNIIMIFCYLNLFSLNF
jgi:predicted ATP-grasp superfamily ATP-dependent carboligase